MPERPPKNQIKTKLYTNGGEFIYKSSGLDYTGYYYINNNQAYAGGFPTTNDVQIELDVAPALVPTGEPSNFLSDIGNTVGFFTDAYTFAKSNLEVAKNIVDKYIPTKSVKSNTPRVGVHYFTQNKLDSNKIIKDVLPTDISLVSLQQDPTYTTVQIDFSSPTVDQQIENGEKQIPGLKTFLSL